MRTIAFLFVMVLLVAACGDSSGDSDELGLGDRDLDRCSLVSAEEAEQWLDSSVIAAPSDAFDGEPDLVTCFYEVEEAPDSVLVQVYDGEVFFSEEGSETRVGETIDELGDDAYFDGDSVHFLQNDWSVSVSRILGINVTDEELMEMAVLISSRLP